MLPIEPHITVESSPGKYHRYILVEDAPLDEVEAVQQRLVDDFGSDPNAKDISRVLRLPGFDHMKNPASPTVCAFWRVWAAATVLGRGPGEAATGGADVQGIEDRGARTWYTAAKSRRDCIGTLGLDPDMPYQDG